MLLCPQGNLSSLNPRAFVEVGICQPDELWTLCSAVYGLRVAPKAWGTYRDNTFRNLTWKIAGDNEKGGEVFRLVQSESDSQVWSIYGSDSEELRGILLV